MTIFVVSYSYFDTDGDTIYETFGCYSSADKAAAAEKQVKELFKSFISGTWIEELPLE